MLFKDTTLAGGIPMCLNCGLFRKCESPRMPVYGEGGRRILLVGEAPGETEDEEGRPFVGKAGQHLRDHLDAVGVDMDEDCWATNAVVCRPPKNVMRPAYLTACRPGLIRAVRQLKPAVIILLGGSAAQQLLTLFWKRSFGSITRWRGWNIPVESFRAWLCPTYHPSYLLRMGEDVVLERIFSDDLKRAIGKENALVIEGCIGQTEIRESILCITDDDEYDERLSAVLASKGRLAIDFETTGLKPEKGGHRIVACSLCLEDRISFAGMVRRKSTRKLLRAIMRSRKLKKVCSNAKYEDRWSRAILGTSMRPVFWDTMLWAHVLDNRPGITSLKFLSFVLFGVGDWEEDAAPFLAARGANALNRIAEVDEMALLRYNATDSLLTSRVMMQQLWQVRELR